MNQNSCRETHPLLWAATTSLGTLGFEVWLAQNYVRVTV